MYAYLEGFELYWGDPVSTGGSAITGFVVLMYDPVTESVDTYEAGAARRGGFIEYYGSGRYGFLIAAVNAAGVGPSAT